MMQLPMYVAVGFVTGYVIAIPLLVGFLLKIVCLNPLFYLYENPQSLLFSLLPIQFKNITETEFILAFCSGMVLYGALNGLSDIVLLSKRFFIYIKQQGRRFYAVSGSSSLPWLQAVSIVLLNSLFLNYFKFSLYAQCYLFLFSGICIYQMMIIAGKMGIIPLGRFATFVMVPGMFLFHLDPIQITLVAAFVEIAGGIAGDVLFGRRLAMLGNIDQNIMKRYQWLGLVVSALAIGIVFWLFITTFGIGKATGLPAIKASSRALLINFKTFDVFVLAMGFVFGYLLRFIKINPALLLGGILMPPNISLMLIAGGLVSLHIKDKERYFPLMSGVSSGNSMWLLAEALFRW
jgi:hypothetical protein